MKNRTLQNILALLPGGFEDCSIQSLHLEIPARSAFIEVALVINRDATGRSILRKGRLSAIGVHTFFMEPPNPHYPFLFNGRGLAASDDMELQGLNGELEKIVEKLPREAEMIRFFFQDWNSFLYLAADAFTFAWIDSDLG